ncbi:polymer-forming cytoskeletal protein [Pseudovibrio ascidiaceicola]|uniref:polymer-forming cytoskeletal protein n=1 Tax=Pseudovibrio ascidiaceicola TaxID=285279 RepID=UPI003D369D06
MNKMKQGSVVISDHREQNIHAKQVVITQNGDLKGDVEADEVIIYGKFSGKIKTEFLKTDATASVHGYVITQKIVLNPVGYYEFSLKNLPPVAEDARPKITKLTPRINTARSTAKSAANTGETANEQVAAEPIRRQFRRF